MQKWNTERLAAFKKLFTSGFVIHEFELGKKFVLTCSLFQVRLSPVKSKPVLVTCPTCKGNQVIELQGELRTTYDQLSRRWKFGATAKELLPALGADIQITAVNNRLSDLLKIGMAVRKREGHSWRYNAVKQQQKTK